MNNKETIKHRQTCVNKYKVSNGCSVCGYNKHPAALCFDHLESETKSEHVKNGYSKRSSAGGMFKLYSKKHPIEDLISEIKKCRVVCHNCHMEKTHKKIQAPGYLPHSMSIENLEFKLKNYD